MDNNYTKIPNSLWKFREELKINTNELMVILYLCRHKNNYRLKNSQIEQETGLCKKAVSKAIGSLSEKKLIDYKEFYSGSRSDGKVYSLKNLLSILNSLEFPGVDSTPENNCSENLDDSNDFPGVDSTPEINNNNFPGVDSTPGSNVFQFPGVISTPGRGHFDPLIILIIKLTIT